MALEDRRRGGRGKGPRYGHADPTIRRVLVCGTYWKSVRLSHTPRRDGLHTREVTEIGVLSPERGFLDSRIRVDDRVCHREVEGGGQLRSPSRLHPLFDTLASVRVYTVGYSSWRPANSKREEA